MRLNPIRRLSIDVDIVTQAKPEELLAVLARVSTLAPLTGYEHDAQRDKDSSSCAVFPSRIKDLLPAPVSPIRPW